MSDEKQIEDESYDKERQLARMRADRFVCDLIGIRLTEVGPGWARAELDLTELHLNGVGIVQGGVLFTLADYAFAAACNYEQEVVGIETSVSYIKAVKSGRIRAEAKEVTRTRKFAICEVQVFDDADRLLVLFRGRGYVLS